MSPSKGKIVSTEEAALDDKPEEFNSIHEPEKGNGCGKGVVRDFKRTVGTHWKSEMTNLNQKTFAVSFFLFFACIAPAISFGAIYAKATHNYIGPVEMILATAWCGIVYALIGGQPMMINGGTGPVLAFSEILYKLSKSLDVPFLPFNAWIGFWVAIYLFLAAIFDLNRVIVYATRFTDEIFSLLIAAIFIINALGSPNAPIGVFHYFNPDHNSHSLFEGDADYSYLASALFSFVLCIGTVQLSFTLRKLKFSPYFPNQTFRDSITDFAVVISILVFSILAYVMNVETEKLNVPDRIAPTFACCTETCEDNWPDDCLSVAEPAGYRSWVVDVFDLNGKTWVIFFAAVPALLAFVLVFLDDGITWHLINHPAHKLKHGDAYNYDTILIGIMVAVNSLLGLPWLVAATVRSLNHIHAMAEKDQNGRILSVQETRLSHLLIHTLCLIVIFALGVLKLIPLPVLYGVFLFMGLLSLATNQFWGRIMMFFMQPSKYPLEPHTKYTSPKRMHAYTAIQLTLFATLYIVKTIKKIAIAFPVIIALCIPIRLYLLPRIFSIEELVMLDSDDETIQAYLEFKARMEEEQEEDDEESADLIKTKDVDGNNNSPGGSTATSSSRSRRVKSTSCPPDMLFAPLTSRSMINFQPRMEIRNNTIAMSNFAGDLAEVSVDPGDVDDEEARDTVNALPDTSDSARAARVAQRRRNRAKTLSCPTPHMLFSEAQRQISSNYFFG